ncbi:MAG: hypothetical protein A2157_13640 [Deltaproteobacteria bacterium RBG_16_47_11]|nr:MAG: hypothetical protein A2157_13640 [Deltaproteobacteria bacterium RBG_16_47_11]
MFTFSRIIYSSDPRKMFDVSTGQGRMIKILQKGGYFLCGRSGLLQLSPKEMDLAQTSKLNSLCHSLQEIYFTYYLCWPAVHTKDSDILKDLALGVGYISR